MPVYDYKCNTCGMTFEYKQKISDDSLTKCPSELCKSEVKGMGEVARVFSKNIGLVFKGTGFYSTDYVNKSSSNIDSNSVTSDSHSNSSCSSGCCCSSN